MIWLDITKTGGAKHFSGLTRVTRRLREELAGSATAHTWANSGAGEIRGGWYLTAEVFAPAERPGFAEFIQARPARLAAIYHDAIPLKLPHITWPQAVARHPAYMTMLASFDQVWAVSSASREELIAFWRWQGRESTPPVEVLPLGADFFPANGATGRPPHPQGVAPSLAAAAKTGKHEAFRSARPPDSASQHGRGGAADPVPLLLCVGIIEPRKNQPFLLDVAEGLWNDGVEFELRVVGRVNPHFGKEILRRMKQLASRERRFRYEGSVSDEELAGWYGRAAACVFPTIAEGCGLPLLEALWFGAPCFCSDLPALRENATGGGCVVLPVNDAAAWAAKLRTFATDSSYRTALAAEAATRRPTLPTWRASAQALVTMLEVERIVPMR